MYSDLLNCPKFNFVAFKADYDIPIGSVSLKPDQPTVEPASQEELLEIFADWGSDVIKIMKCVQSVSKWSIQMVDPPLQSYSKGGVALVGDAVRSYPLGACFEPDMF